MIEKSVPCDIIAEKALLGGLLINGDAVHDVATWLKPNHFYLQRHIWVYEAIVECWRRKVPPDLSTVSDMLRRQDVLNDVGGIAYLGELSADAPLDTRLLVHCGRIVQRTAAHRAIIETGGIISALGYDERQELDDLLRMINEKIRGLNDQQHHPRGISAAELVKMTIPPVRWFIPGILSQGFGYIAAKPGTGKTWMLLQWAVALASGGRVFSDIAVEQCTVLFLALEDSKASIQERIKFVCGDTPPPRDLIIYTEDDGWKALDEGGLNQLEAAIRALQPGVVFIDTLTALAPEPPRGSSPYRGEYKSYLPIRALADAYKVCVVGSWHFNKSGRTDVREMVNSTMGLPAVSVNRIGVVREPDEAVARLKSHSKRGAEIDWSLSFDSTTCQWVKIGDTKEVHLSASRQAILDYLEESGSASIRDLMSVTDMGYNNLLQLLKRMRDSTPPLIISPTKGHYALPDHDSHDSRHDSHDSVMTPGVMTIQGNGKGHTDRHDSMTPIFKVSPAQKPSHESHESHDGIFEPSQSHAGHDSCHDSRSHESHDGSHESHESHDGSHERIRAAGYDIFQVAGRWHVAQNSVKLLTCRTRAEAYRFVLDRMGATHESLSV